MKELKKLTHQEEIVLFGLLNLLISDELDVYKNTKGFNVSKKGGIVLNMLYNTTDSIEEIVYQSAHNSLQFNELADKVEPFVINHKFHSITKLSIYLLCIVEMLTKGNDRFRKPHKKLKRLMDACIDACRSDSEGMVYKAKIHYKSFLSKCIEEVGELNIEFKAE